MSFVDLVVREAEGAGEGCIIVSVSDRTGVGYGPWFRRLLEVQAAERPAHMVVDLSRLPSMDWWAALTLMWVARVVDRRGGTLVLAAPRPAVATLLRSAGVQQVIPVYDTVQQVPCAQTVRQAASAPPASRYGAG